jgi:hypothetical protein
MWSQPEYFLDGWNRYLYINGRPYLFFLVDGESKGTQVVAARDLLCFWASQELGMSATDLAKRLNLTQTAVSIAVRRGEKIARENQYMLMEE